jgi:hypothetical protein
MSDWLHNLPVVWMALVVFGFTYLVTAAIHVVVRVLAVGERARSFKAVSPGMLPPLGIIFGLLIGFTAAQVWSDNDRASAAVDREASALRSVVILAAAFPGEPETRLRALVSSYIAEAAAQEWPMMSHRTITLQIAPHALAEALQQTLALETTGPGQQIAQREITAALESAMDARRQRIRISQSQVNWVKWSSLYPHGVLPFRQREVIDELAAAKKAPAFSKVSFQSVIQAAPVINPAAVRCPNRATIKR